MYFGDILPVDRPRGRYKPSAGLILSIGRECASQAPDGRLDVGLDRTQEAPAAEDRDYTCPPPRPPGAGRVAGRAGGRWAVGSCKWRGRGGCRVSKFTPSAPTSARTTPPWRQGRAAAVQVIRGARLRLLGPLRHGLARRLAADVLGAAANARRWMMTMPPARGRGAPRDGPRRRKSQPYMLPHRPWRLRLPHGPWRWNESRPGLPAGYFETVHVATPARAATAVTRPVEV